MLVGVGTDTKEIMDKRLSQLFAVLPTFFFGTYDDKLGHYTCYIIIQG